METDVLLQMAQRYLMPTYSQLPAVLVKGHGAYVVDSDGKEYVDFASGIAVTVLGHCPEKVVKAIQDQAGRLLHVSNLYYIEPQILFARLLVESSFADRVFFCNSGAEANEGAIKLARAYSRANYGRQERYEIITCYGSFHGRTMAALTATGQEKVQKGFEPLIPGFHYIPFNNVSALEKAITDKTCAFMVEPIQGEGGVVTPDLDYFTEVKLICKDRGILLILDEVQTGMGRTGKLFAYEHYGIIPDIMTLAKSLGGGVPVGALLASEQVSQAFTPSCHASTFGGNPLVCAAAKANLELLLFNDMEIINHCKEIGESLKASFENLKREFPTIIKEVRGIGLMLGIVLNIECFEVVHRCFAKGVLITCAGPMVLRFLPPLNIGKKETEILINTLREIFTEMVDKK